MKQKIFLYLFVFALLFIIFQYVNAKKIHENSNARIENLKKKIGAKDILLTKQLTVIDSIAYENSSHFYVLNDEYALSYLEDQGYDALQLVQTIEDQLIGQNKANVDNPMIPYSGMEGSMHINKVRVLNHKWAIADFTDGTYWGQLLIAFDVKSNQTIDFSVEKHFLYPKQ